MNKVLWTRIYEQGSTNKDLWTRFYKQGSTNKDLWTRFTNKVLRFKKTLQELECYSPTSIQARVLVVQASIAAYLQDLPSRYFSYDLRNARKQENNYQQAMYEDNFSMCPPPRILFWFTSSGFLKWPILLKYWLLRPSFYEEATCKSSTAKGLLYAAKTVPSKDYFTHLTLKNVRKGRWVISPDYCTSNPWRFCAVGDVVAQRYDVPRDWLWESCHMAGIRWGSRCKGLGSKEGPHYCLEQSARKLS
jgi:hypothetical protein